MLVLAAVTAVVAAVRGMWSPCGLSMLSSLNPVAERGRGYRFGVTAAWYVAGAVAGGALLGVALGGGAAALAPVGPTPRRVLALVAAAVAVASDTRVFGHSLPDHPRQVDERWLVTYRRWIYAGGYGVQIGAGFATYIMTAAVYLTAALAMLLGDPLRAFGIGVLFGAVRGLTVLLAAGARTPDRLRAAHRRIAALDGASLAVSVACSSGVAVTAAWWSAGPVAAAAVLLLCVGAGSAAAGIEWGRLRFSR